jgi:anti-sigma28 factor (negative regulator of flagellin synthesis)
MAFTTTEKKEIEVMIRKEIKSFMGNNTINQFENKLIELIKTEIARGKIKGDIKEIVVRMFREFYNFMWTQRGYWEPRIKNA